MVLHKRGKIPVLDSCLLSQFGYDPKALRRNLSTTSDYYFGVITILELRGACNLFSVVGFVTRDDYETQRRVYSCRLYILLVLLG